MFTPHPVVATTTPNIIETSIEAPVLSNEDKVTALVALYGQDLTEVKQKEIIGTIRGESSFHPQQSKYVDKFGNREDSWGVAQIHLPSHPNITREQAMDIDFAVKWTVNEFRNHRESQWTEWRKKYGRGY